MKVERLTITETITITRTTEQVKEEIAPELIKPLSDEAKPISKWKGILEWFKIIIGVAAIGSSISKMLEHFT